MILLRLLLVFLLVVPGWAGGGIEFDASSDNYNCGDIDTTGSSLLSVVVQIQPNFSSSSTAGKSIMSRIDWNTCPPLPGNCLGSNCGDGWAVFYNSTGFVMLAADTKKCGGISVLTPCSVSPTFSTGDQIALFFYFTDGLQQCRAYVNGVDASNNTGFEPWTLSDNAQNVHIGYGPATDTFRHYWDGTIDFVGIWEGRASTAWDDELANPHQRSFWPQFMGWATGAQTSPAVPYFVADMDEGGIGDEVATLYPREDTTGSGNCSGSGTSTTTRAMW